MGGHGVVVPGGDGGEGSWWEPVQARATGVFNSMDEGANLRLRIVRLGYSARV